MERAVVTSSKKKISAKKRRAECYPGTEFQVGGHGRTLWVLLTRTTSARVFVENVDGALERVLVSAFLPDLS
jgi:hypothetical protein